MPRFHCETLLSPAAEFALPATAARHVQVLRLQPGARITLFDGAGGEWSAEVLRMGRSDVVVRTLAHDPVEREAARAVTLAVGMPANDRMDWLVEKATELGVARVVPVQTAHGVLRLAGDRAERKQAHWRAVAVAACEQCGRNRVPAVAPVIALDDWLAEPGAGAARAVLSLAPGSRPLADWLGSLPAGAPVAFLSGPEGGLSPAEDARARAAGWAPVNLGARVLRAETAALAALTLATA